MIAKTYEVLWVVLCVIAILLCGYLSGYEARSLSVETELAAAIDSVHKADMGWHFRTLGDFLRDNTIPYDEGVLWDSLTTFIEMGEMSLITVQKWRDNWEVQACRFKSPYIGFKVEDEPSRDRAMAKLYADLLDARRKGVLK